MSALVNLSKPGTRMLMVDAASLTSVHINPAKDDFALYTADGPQIHGKMQSYNTDGETILTVLKGAGLKLAALPIRWPDEGKDYHTSYIVPSAVSYMTLPLAKQGLTGMLAGVKGVGWEESYRLKPEERDAFVAAVLAGKRMTRFTPETAHSRWYDAEALYIDPKEITAIVEDAVQVNLHFDRVGRLDVQVPRADVNDFFPKGIMENWPKDQAKAQDIVRKASLDAKAHEHTLRAGFAAAIARANGALIHVPKKDEAIYISPAICRHVTMSQSASGDAYRWHMGISPARPNRDSEAIAVWFNNEAEWQKAGEALQRGLRRAGGKTPPTPRPQGPA